MLHCTSALVNPTATQVVTESEYKWAYRPLRCIVVQVFPLFCQILYAGLRLTGMYVAGSGGSFIKHTK